MTGPFVPVGILNLIRRLRGNPRHRFNLFVKCSSERIPCIGVAVVYAGLFTALVAVFVLASHASLAI
jgi:hypothetical protein